MIIMHWFDELFSDADSFVKGRENLRVNAGLSVSGLQHVGRLRGEIVLSHAIAERFRKSGRATVQSLVLYTQDQWKATEGQVSQFPGEEGRKYKGWRLIDVPDPFGCHTNWVEHYWQDFGNFMDDFAPDIEVVTTTQAYQMPEMKALVLDLARRSEEVRVVVNKYRARKPYPPGWIPFEPICESCRRISQARALGFEGERVMYECVCGHRGKSPIEKGKLNWRLEWAALWKVFEVDVEPFGKDHATPGGSRDSCKDIARNLMHFEPPFGIPYEWVGISERGVDLGDMGSSDFLGFSPKEWREVGDPEVLRYLYLFNPISRRLVLDMSKVDAYHDTYDMAERLFYSPDREEEEENMARSYALAQLKPPAEEQPFQLPYRHAAFLSQISPKEGKVEWCIRRLQDTGILEFDPTPSERQHIENRISQAGGWVQRYAPEYKVVLLDRVTEEISRQLDDADRKALRIFVERAAEVEWREESIKSSMVSLTKGGTLPVDTNRFFRDLYLVLLGSERGPRAAPFLAVLKKDFVLGRIKEVTG